MPTPAPSAAIDEFPFDKAQKILADKLFRHAWSPQQSPDGRYNLFHELLGVHVSEELTSPVVGVGISKSDNGRYRIELLAGVGHDMIDPERLFSATGLKDTPFNLRKGCSPVPAARPASGGDSLGDWKGSEGTFGCLVEAQTGEKYILSCNHVTAGLNSGRRCVDETHQPGRGGGQIGLLYDFEDIAFGGGTANVIDAAITKPDDPTDVKAGVGSVPIQGVYDPVPFQTSVFKVGIASGTTYGVVSIQKLSILMPYTTTQKALFERQIGIIGSGKGNFAKGGDSGAVVLDDNGNRAVGLLFGTDGGIDLAYVNPINLVIARFSVSIC